ncbi:MAG: WhiB family transcriptional regulator [Actinomycetota bacterium]
MTNALTTRPAVNPHDHELTDHATLNDPQELDMTTFEPPAEGISRPDQLDPDSPPGPIAERIDTIEPVRDLDGDVDAAAASLAARRPVARCADGNGTLTALFFSDHVADIARAKAMCGLCPLQAECLAGALEREEPWGVWGGELISGGRVIANKRPCGRPPKRPRPEVVYDEMGPVEPVRVAV